MKKGHGIILVAFLAMLVAFTGCSGGGKTDEVDKVDSEIGVLALAALADSHIESYVHSLEVLAMTQEVQSGEWTQMKGLLSKVEQTQVPSTIWFVLPNGDYYTVDLDLTGEKLSDQAYFSGLMDGNEVLGNLAASRITESKSLIAAVPVFNGNSVIGGLGVSISLSDLSDLLVDEAGLSSNMVFYAVTGDSEVALHSDTELILRESPSLSENVVSVTSELIGWEFSLGFE